MKLFADCLIIYSGILLWFSWATPNSTLLVFANIDTMITVLRASGMLLTSHIPHYFVIALVVLKAF